MSRADEISEKFDNEGMSAISKDDVEHLLSEAIELQVIYDDVSLWIENTYSYFGRETSSVSPECVLIDLLEGIARMFKESTKSSGGQPDDT